LSASPPAESTQSARDHLANERTFLAWVRTAIGVIVFGFALARFGLALRQLGALQGSAVQTTGMSLWFGCGAILLGVVLMIAALARYKRIEHRLTQGTFESSGKLILLVSAATTIFGVALIFYLVFAERALVGR
jgi:inner membrane protein YidH